MKHQTDIEIEIENVNDEIKQLNELREVGSLGDATDIQNHVDKHRSLLVKLNTLTWVLAN